MSVEQLVAIATQLATVAGDISQCSEKLVSLAEKLYNTDMPAWTDLRAQLATNPAPDEPWLKARGIKDWWRRTPEQIDGITIHHVASVGTPQATAIYCTRPKAQGGKGLPRTQYNYWIDPDGTIYYCLDVLYGPWHDNCGHENTHVSIAMNGALHRTQPTTTALLSTARLVAWLMREYAISLENVTGHNEWAMRCLGLSKNFTQCPGWTVMGWKTNFYAALDGMLEERALSSLAFGVRAQAMVEIDAEAQQELDALGRGEDDDGH